MGERKKEREERGEKERAEMERDQVRKLEMRNTKRESRGGQGAGKTEKERE